MPDLDCPCNSSNGADWFEFCVELDKPIIPWSLSSDSNRPYSTIRVSLSASDGGLQAIVLTVKNDQVSLKLYGSTDTPSDSVTVELSAGEMQDVLVFGDNPSTAVGSAQVGLRLVGAETDCDTVTLTVAKVIIKRDTIDITNTTQTVKVGERVNLEGEVIPSGLTLLDHQWDIPGVHNQGWTYSDNSSVVDEITASELLSSDIGFYWVDGASGRDVTYSVKVNGVPFSAKATFNILRPDYALVYANPGSGIAIDTNYWLSSGAQATVPFLHFGEGNKPGGGLAGMSAEYQLDTSAFPGEIMFVQIITPDIAYILPNRGGNLGMVGPLGATNSTRSLDVALSVTNAPFVLTDSPGLTTVQGDMVFDSLQIRSPFEVWVMYRPTGAGITDSIFVPLKQFSWTWYGVSSRRNGAWINPPQSSGHATSADVSPQPTFIYPAWDHNMSSNRLMVIPPPPP